MNDTLDHHALATWMKEATPPCLSLYMPTERAFPQREQNVIRFKNLLRQLEADLVERFPEADHVALLAPLQTLVDNADFGTTRAAAWPSCATAISSGCSRYWIPWKRPPGSITTSSCSRCCAWPRRGIAIRCCA